MSPLATTLAFAALLILTALTFFLSGLGLGGPEVPIALGIGAVKALIVAAVFVELATDRFAHRMTLAVAAVLALLLIAFASADVLTRP